MNCCLYTKESALVKNIILELGMYSFSPSYYNYVLVIKMSTANKDIKWLNRYLLIFFKFGNKSLSIPCISTRSKSMVYWSPFYVVFIQQCCWTFNNIVLNFVFAISIGNSVICSDICHKYHEWYFEIVIRNFTSR